MGGRGIRAVMMVLAPFLFIPAGHANSNDAEKLALDAPELAQLLRTKHVSPYWLNGEAQFARIERELLASAKTAAHREVLLTQMLRLIAAIGDGHTVMASEDRYHEFGIAPFSAELFDDGVFIVRAGKPQAENLGAQILAIGDVPIDQALGALRTVIPHSTESRFRRWLRAYLHLPGLLYGLGLSDTPAATTLTLRLTSGRIVENTFQRITVDVYDTLEFADTEPAQSLRNKNGGAKYWFEALPEHNAVYFSFRRMASDDVESVFAFGVRLTEYLKQNSPSRLIIDLRENGGGGYQFAAHLRPLLNGVPSLQRPGGILVLTGPKTYSAAGDFLSQLERFTYATLIGLPPAGRNGEPGDDDDFVLPNSGITIRISQIASHPGGGVDARSVIDVQKRIPETFADILAGRDPALQEALNYQPPAVKKATPSPRWQGRFAFDLESDLTIREENGEWRAAVIPQMDTPLTAAGATRFRAQLSGLTLVLDTERDGVRMILADGSERFCPRKAKDEPSAWELVLQGRVQEAEPKLRKAIEENPVSPTLSDFNLPAEAIHVFYTLRSTAGVDEARSAARQLLEAGIRLHPEGAPNSTFSLRFYPAPESGKP